MPVKTRERPQERKVKKKEEFVRGSGNVFADLGLEDSEEELAKAQLALAIRRIIKARGLTQVEAARLLNTDQARVSELMNGKIAAMTYDRLLKFLRAMDYNVRFVFEPVPQDPERARVLEEELKTLALAG